MDVELHVTNFIIDVKFIFFSFFLWKVTDKFHLKEKEYKGNQKTKNKGTRVLSPRKIQLEGYYQNIKAPVKKIKWKVMMMKLLSQYNIKNYHQNVSSIFKKIKYIIKTYFLINLRGSSTALGLCGHVIKVYQPRAAQIQG